MDDETSELENHEHSEHDSSLDLYQQEPLHFELETARIVVHVGRAIIVRVNRQNKSTDQSTTSGFFSIKSMIIRRSAERGKRLGQKTGYGIAEKMRCGLCKLCRCVLSRLESDTTDSRSGRIRLLSHDDSSSDSLNKPELR